MIDYLFFLVLNCYNVLTQSSSTLTLTLTIGARSVLVVGLTELNNFV